MINMIKKVRTVLLKVIRKYLLCRNHLVQVKIAKIFWSENLDFQVIGYFLEILFRKNIDFLDLEDLNKIVDFLKICKDLPISLSTAHVSQLRGDLCGRVDDLPGGPGGEALPSIELKQILEHLYECSGSDDCIKYPGIPGGGAMYKNSLNEGKMDSMDNSLNVGKMGFNGNSLGAGKNNSRENIYKSEWFGLIQEFRLLLNKFNTIFNSFSEGTPGQYSLDGDETDTSVIRTASAFQQARVVENRSTVNFVRFPFGNRKLGFEVSALNNFEYFPVFQIPRLQVSLDQTANATWHMGVARAFEPDQTVQNRFRNMDVENSCRRFEAPNK